MSPSLLERIRRELGPVIFVLPRAGEPPRSPADDLVLLHVPPGERKAGPMEFYPGKQRK